MKNTFKYMLLGCLMLIGILAQAQNKIGYFDINYVLPQMPEYKKAEADMNTYGKQVEQELKSKKEEFEKKYAAYMEAAQKGSLTPAIDEAKQRELQSLDQQYKDFQQSINRDMQQRRNGLLSPIYEKIEKNITEVAQASGFNHVLRAETCYVPVKANNISDSVLKKMGITPAVQPTGGR